MILHHKRFECSKQKGEDPETKLSSGMTSRLNECLDSKEYIAKGTDWKGEDIIRPKKRKITSEEIHSSKSFFAYLDKNN